MAAKAIPAHLRTPAESGAEGESFQRKHHGKSQSHMVCTRFSTFQFLSAVLWIESPFRVGAKTIKHSANF